jgi:hypothetical protein
VHVVLFNEMKRNVFGVPMRGVSCLVLNERQDQLGLQDACCSEAF